MLLLLGLYTIPPLLRAGNALPSLGKDAADAGAALLNPLNFCNALGRSKRTDRVQLKGCFESLPSTINTTTSINYTGRTE